jgi:hypothetical protein
MKVDWGPSLNVDTRYLDPNRVTRARRQERERERERERTGSGWNNMSRPHTLRCNGPYPSDYTTADPANMSGRTRWGKNDGWGILTVEYICMYILHSPLRSRSNAFFLLPTRYHRCNLRRRATSSIIPHIIIFRARLTEITLFLACTHKRDR